MPREEFHLSDEEILLALDGELSRRRAEQVRAHLTECGLCRSRSGKLESTIVDFVALHHRTTDSELPSSEGPRALLKARLALEARQPVGLMPRFLSFLLPLRVPVYIPLMLFVTLSGAGLLRWTSHLQRSTLRQVAVERPAIPDPRLTPGAVRPVSIDQVCSMVHEDVVRSVPSSLRQQVFQEYGITNARPEDYEIDYLIAPGLGGTEDIRNLWPEPSTALAWNAHVKDALEERLHQLVCAGKLDLPTAQRAIATDWITAYKKYLPSGGYAS